MRNAFGQPQSVVVLGGTSDLALAMSGAKIKTPSCEEAAWRLFGLSMAGFNVLISLKLAAWSGLAALGWRAGK